MPKRRSPQRALSRLESLPGELRNRIYYYAVVQEQPIIDTTLIESRSYNIPGTIVDKLTLTWRHTEPALAKACKLFRHEVLSIFYTENTFVLTPNPYDADRVRGKQAHDWVRSTGKYSSMISSAGVRFYVRKNLDEGQIEDVKCEIMAKVPDEGDCKFFITGGLEGQCECKLRFCERLQPTGSKYSRLSIALGCCSEFLLREYIEETTFCFVCRRSYGL